jgi:apolipoprotein N-acyltransferase
MYLYGGLPKPVALAILFLFALYLGLYHALFALLLSFARRAGCSRNSVLLLAPFVWVAVELARARITGFPWDLLGLTQIDNPVLARLAPITGAYGMSFVVAFLNSLWLMRVTLRSRRYTVPILTLAGVVFFTAYLLMLHTLPEPKQNPATATANLVQENLSVGAARTGPPESQSQMLDAFTYLSTHPSPTFLSGIPEVPGTPEVVVLHDAGAHKTEEGEGQMQMANQEPLPWTPPTDLIVWPEAPSGFQTDDPEFLRRMHQLADSSHALLIIGSLGVVPNRDRETSSDRPYLVYDSAAFFTPDTPGNGRYDKIHLVPFGEYVPFKDLFFFAKKLTAGVGDMDRGAERTVYRIDSRTNGVHAYGAFVCYESIFGDEVRQFVRDGAEVLVNISDDGWYGDTGAAWQHLNMVRMRAIENHRWILRSTNTGVTAAIDPAGYVTAAVPRHVRTSLHAYFGYETDVTFYTKYGDIFAYACALITLAGFAFALKR